MSKENVTSKYVTMYTLPYISTVWLLTGWLVGRLTVPVAVTICVGNKLSNSIAYFPNNFSWLFSRVRLYLPQ